MCSPSLYGIHKKKKKSRHLPFINQQQTLKTFKKQTKLRKSLRVGTDNADFIKGYLPELHKIADHLIER